MYVYHSILLFEEIFLGKNSHVVSRNSSLLKMRQVVTRKTSETECRGHSHGHSHGHGHGHGHRHGVLRL
jgi:hypothetical protein